MTEILRQAWSDRYFLLLLAFDWILVYSLVFSVVYSLYVLALSMSFGRVGRPRPFTIPAVFLLSFLIMLTPVKDVLTAYFGGAFNELSFRIRNRTGFEGIGYVFMLAWLAGAVLCGVKLVWRLASLRRFLSMLPPAGGGRGVGTGLCGGGSSRRCGCTGRR
jgi:hypothetical protein